MAVVPFIDAQPIPKNVLCSPVYVLTAILLDVPRYPST